jgi:arabinose-5-phosphate isomerase
MHTGEEMPRVEMGTSLPNTILEITTKRLGATCVMNSDGGLEGIITDGDLRRLIEKRHDIWELAAEDVMTQNPKTIRSGVLAAKAILIMEENSITQLVVVDHDENPVGIIHLHDLLKAGLA